MEREHNEIKPKIFIGSSLESEDIAKLVKHSLEPECECVNWKDQFFQMNQSTYDTLIKKAMGFDYAVFVGGKDDRVSRLGTLRGRGKYSPRDNIYLELGLYTGILTKERTFFLLHESVTVASDLMGIMMLHYKSRIEVMNACRRIKEKIEEEERISRIGFLPSTSLAIGYFHNFLSQIGSALVNLETVEINGVIYSIEENRKYVDIVIPENVEEDWQPWAKEFYKKNNCVCVDIGGTIRKMNVMINFESLKRKQEIHILEVPQTLRSAFYAVDLASGKDFTGEIRSNIEVKKKEVRNFVRTVNNLVNSMPHMKERINFKSVASCDTKL